MLNDFDTLSSECKSIVTGTSSCLYQDGLHISRCLMIAEETRVSVDQILPSKFELLKTKPYQNRFTVCLSHALFSETTVLIDAKSGSNNVAVG